MTRIPAEIAFGGIYFPPALILCLAGFVLSLILVGILKVTGLGRFIWHPPLFFIALVVLLSSILYIQF